MLLSSTNVTVNTIGDSLMVQGSDTANSIRIEDAGNGLLRFVGFDGTTVNGATSVVVTNDLAVNLKLSGGADRLEIGSKAESTVRFLRKVSIDMGAGSDVVDIYNAGFKGRLKIDFGESGTEVDKEIATIRNSNVRSLRFNGGTAGSAELTVQSTNVNNSARIRSSNLNFTASFSGCQVGGVNFSTGTENVKALTSHNVRIQDSTVTGTIAAEFGKVRGNVTLKKTQTAIIDIKFGNSSENDSLVMNDCTAKSLTATDSGGGRLDQVSGLGNVFESAPVLIGFDSIIIKWRRPRK